MTHTTMNRRRALAVVASVPAAAVLGFVPADAAARVEHHTRELEKAMLDLYGPDGMVACVMVAANGGATARPAANSKWLYAGRDRRASRGLTPHGWH